MKEHPILFSAPMIRAILEGRKTQTRRVVKNQPKIDPQTGDWLFYSLPDCESVRPIEEYIDSAAKRCPYGQPGDRLWVRETFSQIEQRVYYAADYEFGGAGAMISALGKWKPSIHMPRAASRITLEITDVRVERLQDISEADAVAEGIEPVSTNVGTFYGNYGKDDIGTALHPIESYKTLWQSINGEGAWARNPFVWAITFKRIKP